MAARRYVHGIVTVSPVMPCITATTAVITMITTITTTVSATATASASTCAVVAVRWSCCVLLFVCAVKDARYLSEVFLPPIQGGYREPHTPYRESAQESRDGNKVF